MAKTNPMTGKPYSENSLKLLADRMQLPIWTHREEFMQLLESNQTIIVAAGNDSGKSTQIPQFLAEYLQNAESKNPTIACSQTRRANAINAATRVAAEMDVELGAEVGYSIRFDRRLCPTTQLKFLTDGALLREAIGSPHFADYSGVVVDNGDEGSLCTGALMGLLWETVKKRADLKLIVMIAATEVDKFRGYFGNCSLMTVSAPENAAISDKIENSTEPRIRSAELSAVFLCLKKIGIENLAEFEFLDSPPAESRQNALELLTRLEAIDSNGDLTKLGSRMAEFPLEPRMSKALIASVELGCVEAVLIIIAMLSVRHGFGDLTKAKFAHSGGNHLTLLNIFNAFQQSKSTNPTIMASDRDNQKWFGDNGLDYEQLKNADRIRSELAQLMDGSVLKRLSPGSDANSTDYCSNILTALSAGLLE